MNKKDSKLIAETITNEELAEMFVQAKLKITDWTTTSLVNKCMSKGVSWSILAKVFDQSHQYHILGKTNMVREFGEFLPENLKPKKKQKNNLNPPIHKNLILTNMKTKEQITEEFLADLKILLKKHDASISIEEQNHLPYTRGEDHMVVTLQSEYKNCECIKEYTEIDLGNYISDE